MDPARGLFVRRLGILLVVGVLLGGSALVVTAAQPSGSTQPTTTSTSAAASETLESEAHEASEAPESEAPEPSGAGARTDAETPEGPPSPDDVAYAVSRLAAAGISTSGTDFAAIAAKVGVGGAVRVFAFAKASGKSPAQILSMFTGGMGWGEIAQQLKLSIGPGIGSIMGRGQGNGHGNGSAKVKAEP